MKKRSLLMASAVFLAVFLATSVMSQGQLSAQAQQSSAKYTVQDLGLMGSGGWSEANAINNSGHVVGESQFSFIYASTGHAFLYSEPLGMTDIGRLILGGGPSRALDINEAGQVVFNRYDGSERAYLYENGVIKDLGALGGYTDRSGYFVTVAKAQGINNLGQVVGTSSITSDGTSAGGSQARHAFLYENGQMKDLGIGANFSQAEAINDSGQVVGFARDNTAAQYSAFLYEDGSTKNLGVNSVAVDINDSGQVVGQSGGQAFLYENGQMNNLGNLGGTNSSAAAINDSGQVVGAAWGGTVNSVFLYENGVMKDLNVLIGQASSGWKIAWVTDINNKGQITAVGRPAWNPSGSYRALRLTPEPTTKPTASFTAEPTKIDRTVRLDASGSTPAPGGSITQYEWDFGDGTPPTTSSAAIDSGDGATLTRSSAATDFGDGATLTTSSPTITHKFPEGDRDYPVKLVVVSDKGVRSDPYTLNVRSPHIPPKAVIGTLDNIEPAIDTPRFSSTLEVKSVEGLGCSIDGTDGPACKFEWLRTDTQQKSDVNFLPSSDTIAPDRLYHLRWNGNGANEDEWHKFKVKVTNPETNDSVDSNVIEVDTMPGRVEAIMLKNGWEKGAKLQKNWKESAPAEKPNFAFTDKDTIKMAWVLDKFERAKDEYNKILTTVRTNDQKQQAQIEKLLDRYKMRDGQPTSFGDFETDGMAKLDLDSIQSEGVGETRLAKLFVPLDDLTAALNAFEFKAAVSGKIEPVPGEKKLRVRINEVGIFIEDTFDFVGYEPLGCWDPLDNTLSKNIPGTCVGTSLENADYREWRAHHSKGGDFKVYSDIKREPLNLEFMVNPVSYQ
jgi:probable HAF family extracellular repeat protein